MTTCPTDPLPGDIPRDGDGPVFREPWEARVFALAVRLNEAGLFTWTEWAEALSAEIRRTAEADEPDTAHAYYRHWLRALEALLARKGLLAPGDLENRIAAAGPQGHGGHEHGHGHDH